MGGPRGRRGHGRGPAAGPAAPAATSESTALLWMRLRASLVRLGAHILDGLVLRRARQTAIAQPPIRDAKVRRDVAHGIEGAIVRHDLEDVAGPRGAEPDAGGNRDAQVAPVLHADRWR